jgi:hypothetical protein
MTLNLYRVWEILQAISAESDTLEEKGIYESLLGNSSMYSSMLFESFLPFYSFKIEGNNLIVFNNDGIPYEDYSNDDYSFLPLTVLEMTNLELRVWIDEETERQLNTIEERQVLEKENLKLEIERLQKRLNTY